MQAQQAILAEAKAKLDALRAPKPAALLIEAAPGSCAEVKAGAEVGTLRAYWRGADAI